MDLQQSVQYELNKIHYQRSRAFYFPTLVLLLISLYFQREQSDTLRFFVIPLSLILSGTLLRIVMYEVYFEEWKRGVTWARFLNCAGFFLQALAWVVHFFQVSLIYGQNSSHAAYTLLIIGGFVLAGANILVASRESFWSFTGTLFLGIILTYIIQSGFGNKFGIMMVILYFLFSFKNYRISYGQLSDLISSEILAKREHEKLSGIINTVPGFVGLINKEGYCYLANQTTLTVYPGILGKKLGTIDPTSEWEKFVQDFMNSDKDYDISEQMTTITGTAIYALMNVQKMDDGGVIIVSIITTELVEARNKIKEQEIREQYTAKLVSLGEMAAGIAHEVNNPLTIILGSANVLKSVVEDGPIDKEMVKNLANKIVETTERISKTIRSMKSLSGNGENEPMLILPLGKVLELATEVVEEQFKSNAITLKVDPKLNEIEFLGREIQISQVLVNLLSNAADSVKKLPERWVEIKGQISGPYIDLFIIDSGPGIPAELKDKIMEPFFTTKEASQGTGLGLSISRKILLEHGGELNLIPDAPKTTFQIRLKRPF